MKLDPDDRRTQYFKEYASVQTDQFYVNGMKWSGDSLLLLDATTSEGYHENYKVSIPE